MDRSLVQIYLSHLNRMDPTNSLLKNAAAFHAAQSVTASSSSSTMQPPLVLSRAAVVTAVRRLQCKVNGFLFSSPSKKNSLVFLLSLFGSPRTDWACVPKQSQCHAQRFMPSSVLCVASVKPNSSSQSSRKCHSSGCLSIARRFSSGCN